MLMNKRGIKSNVVEMTILRINGHIRQDRIKTRSIRKKVVVATIEEKVIEFKLMWFGHAWRRLAEALGTRVNWVKIAKSQELERDQEQL